MSDEQLEQKLITLLLEAMERQEFPEHDAITFKQAGLPGPGIVIVFFDQHEQVGLAIQRGV